MNNSLQQVSKDLQSKTDWPLDCVTYLHFVKVCLVSMPGIIKVDSVWTTFVETPHPSLTKN